MTTSAFFLCQSNRPAGERFAIDAFCQKNTAVATPWQARLCAACRIGASSGCGCCAGATARHGKAGVTRGQELENRAVMNSMLGRLLSNIVRRQLGSQTKAEEWDQWSGGLRSRCGVVGGGSCSVSLPAAAAASQLDAHPSRTCSRFRVWANRYVLCPFTESRRPRGTMAVRSRAARCAGGS